MMTSTWRRSAASGLAIGLLALAARSAAAPQLPVGILQATYIGGQQAAASVRAMVIDAANGDVILAGTAQSGDIPGTAGGAHDTIAGGQDGWVARLSSDLRTVKQATYLGGTSSDEIDAVAIDPTTDDIVVAGYTSSDDLPTTTGGAQAHLAGPSDAFVARFSADLTTASQTTYLGGSAAESGAILGVAVDAMTGDVVVAGTTASIDFPGSASGAQKTCGGMPCGAGFVARLKGDLKTLIRSTYVGGAGLDNVYDVALQPLNGDVLVVGDSAPPNDPGRLVGVVTCYDSQLRTLKGLAQIGTSGAQTVAWGLTVDPQLGDVIVTGETRGPLEDTTHGAQHNFGGGDTDVFVARYDIDLFLREETYLGGTHDESGVVKPTIRPSTGEIIVAGRTTSQDFPKTSGGAQPAFDGSAQDGFVARLTPELDAIVQSTYVGGSAADDVYAIAVRLDSSEVLVAGATASSDFPATAGGVQPSFAPPTPGSSAGFAVRIGAELDSGLPTPTPTTAPTPTATRPRTTVCAGDCSGEHRVTVDDLIKGVNIALGNVALDSCAAFDLNGDGAVEVNELISAVTSALNGCA